MKTKHILAVCIFALFLIGSKLTAQTVYVTESGKKYHSKNCDIVKTGKKGITLEEAKKRGLEPCKSCKVESVAKADGNIKEAEKAKLTDKPKK